MRRVHPVFKLGFFFDFIEFAVTASCSLYTMCMIFLFFFFQRLCDVTRLQVFCFVFPLSLLPDTCGFSS